MRLETASLISFGQSPLDRHVFVAILDELSDVLAQLPHDRTPLVLQQLQPALHSSDHPLAFGSFSPPEQDVEHGRDVSEAASSRALQGSREHRVLNQQA